MLAVKIRVVCTTVFQVEIRPPVAGDSHGSLEGFVDCQGRAAQFFLGHINNPHSSHLILEMRVQGKFEVLFAKGH